MDLANTIFLSGLFILILAAFLGVPPVYFYVVGGILGIAGFSGIFYPPVVE